MEEVEDVELNAQDKALFSLIQGLSDKEKRAFIKGLEGSPISEQHDHTECFATRKMKFGYYADPHVGHKEFREDLWVRMITYFRRFGVKVVYSIGDNLEGMSGRPGHIYELNAIGADAQMKLASELFALAPDLDFNIIDGNHDLWYKDKNNAGLIVGKELAVRNANVTFLGEWEANIKLAEGVTMILFHGNDGTAYASSYKIQKLIESLEGGAKPNLLLSGHYHKQIQLFTRNVFGFECGTLCGQTRWMRGKKIAAHKGFGIVEIWVKKRGGIDRLRHEFVPCYD